MARFSVTAVQRLLFEELTEDTCGLHVFDGHNWSLRARYPVRLFKGDFNMSSLSIIVPYLGQQGPFEDTLASILRCRPDESEIIVVHDGSYADPYQLAGELSFAIVDNAAGPFDYFAVGIAKSTREWVHWLLPGVEVDEGWLDSISSDLANPAVSAAVPLVVDSIDDDEIIAAGVAVNQFYRGKLVGGGRKRTIRGVSRIKMDGPCRWAALYRRELIDAIVRSEIEFHSQWFDVEIAGILRELGINVAIDHDCFVTIDDPDSIDRQQRIGQDRIPVRMMWRHVTGRRATTRAWIVVGGMISDLCAATVNPRRISDAAARLFAIGESSQQRLAMTAMYDRLRRHIGDRHLHELPGKPDQPSRRRAA